MFIISKIGLELVFSNLRYTKDRDYEQFEFEYIIDKKTIFKHSYELLTDNFEYLQRTLKELLVTNEDEKFISFQEPDFSFKFEYIPVNRFSSNDYFKVFVIIDSDSWVHSGYGDCGLSAYFIFSRKDINKLIINLDNFIKEKSNKE